MICARTDCTNEATIIHSQRINQKGELKQVLWCSPCNYKRRANEKANRRIKTSPSKRQIEFTRSWTEQAYERYRELSKKYEKVAHG